MLCFHVLTLAFVLVLVNYRQRARAVTTCDFDLYVNKTGCTGPLMSSLPELGTQGGGSSFSGGTEHLASPYCIKSSGGGGFFGSGSIHFLHSDNNCTVYLEYAPTYELLECAISGSSDTLGLDINYDSDPIPCYTWPLLGPAPGAGLPETAPWSLSCVCSPDTVDYLLVVGFPSTSSPSSSASPASAASSSSNAPAPDSASSSISTASSSSSIAPAKASTSPSIPAPTSDNNLQQVSNNLQAKSIKVQLGVGLGIGIPGLILAFFTIRCFVR